MKFEVLVEVVVIMKIFGMWCHVTWQIFINILELSDASVFKQKSKPYEKKKSQWYTEARTRIVVKNKPTVYPPTPHPNIAASSPRMLVKYLPHYTMSHPRRQQFHSVTDSYKIYLLFRCNNYLNYNHMFFFNKFVSCSYMGTIISVLQRMLFLHSNLIHYTAIMAWYVHFSFGCCNYHITGTEASVSTKATGASGSEYISFTEVLVNKVFSRTLQVYHSKTDVLKKIRQSTAQPP